MQIEGAPYGYFTYSIYQHLHYKFRELGLAWKAIL